MGLVGPGGLCKDLGFSLIGTGWAVSSEVT